MSGMVAIQAETGSFLSIHGDPMSVQSDHGVRAPVKKNPDGLLSQPNCSDQEVDDEATVKCPAPLQTHRSVPQQLMHNLIFALGAWPT